MKEKCKDEEIYVPQSAREVLTPIENTRADANDTNINLFIFALFFLLLTVRQSYASGPHARRDHKLLKGCRYMEAPKERARRQALTILRICNAFHRMVTLPSVSTRGGTRLFPNRLRFMRSFLITRDISDGVYASQTRSCAPLQFGDNRWHDFLEIRL